MRNLLYGLALGILTFSWSGCSLSLPVKLVELTGLDTTELHVAKDIPQLAMEIHPDGLGWQVFVSQAVTRTVAIEADEYWQYRTYDLSGRSSSTRVENYDDICGPLLLLTPLVAPLNVEDPPYWTRWDRMFSACAGSDTNSTRTLHSHHRVRQEDHIGTEAVKEGYLTLAWEATGRPPIVATIPLDNNANDTGTAVRLRWLAELVHRAENWFSTPPEGTVELRLVQHDRTILRKRLHILPQDLESSLRDEHIVSASVDQWPRNFVVRVASESGPLSPADSTLLLQELVVALDRLAVPVVLRDRELDLWRTDQVRFHHPQYHALPSVDPAHAQGATVLFHLDVQEPLPHTRKLTMHVVNITTGELLATLTTGGHESQWPYVVEMGMRDVEVLLHRLRDLGPSKSSNLRQRPVQGGHP